VSTGRDHDPGPARSSAPGIRCSRGREEHVEPVESFGRFDVEQATAAPGEKR
jgi:hypothetical protein